MTGNCGYSEYGDLLDAMGSNLPYHFNAAEKDLLGWLGGGRTRTISGDATVTLTPFEDSAIAVKAAKVVTPAQTYWLEYRQPVGVDASLSDYPLSTQGVLVHTRAQSGGSDLLDMRPDAMFSFADATLGLGASWVSPERVMFRVDSLSATGAVVAVDFDSAAGATCEGLPATIVGSGVITGTPGDDVIVGSASDDVVSGLDGNDMICVGAGSDTADGGFGNDLIRGDVGLDEILGGPGDDQLFGGPDDDELSGMAGNDQLTGGPHGTGDLCVQGSGTGSLSQCERSTLPVAITGSTASEGNTGTSPLSFTVAVPIPTDLVTTVSAKTVDGTAKAATDYDALPLTPVTIPAGARQASFAVNVRGDTTDEQDESFTVPLSNPSVGAAIAGAAGVGTIVDDDTGGGGGAIQISVADRATGEGNSGTKILSFAVRLSAASSQAVTVQYRTVNGSAVAPSDYLTKPLTTLTIPAGTTSKAVKITIKGDRTVESTESFTLRLSNPVNASLPDPDAIGTITNDD